jgi:hypothetical protein
MRYCSGKAEAVIEAASELHTAPALSLGHIWANGASLLTQEANALCSTVGLMHFHVQTIVAVVITVPQSTAIAIIVIIVVITIIITIIILIIIIFTIIVITASSTTIINTNTTPVVNHKPLQQPLHNSIASQPTNHHIP